MPDDRATIPVPAKHGPRTRLSHVGRAGVRVHAFVNPPVHRGSTMLHEDMADRRRYQQFKHEQVLGYGIVGGPTHHALEDAVSEIEGGTRCQIVSSGLAAVTTALQAFVKAGDHLLVTDSCYGPTRNFCNEFLAHFGVETTYYPPGVDEAGMRALMRPNTRAVYVESPGTHTFEMQDIPAIARAAHAHGEPGQVRVLADNSWGFGLFNAFEHGVDVAFHALTKYAGGHSDIMLGSIVTRTQADWDRVRATALLLGQYASPDDAWLCLRGLRTLSVRLDRQQESALTIARWLANRPEVRVVRYPALPGTPGHEIWKRDFAGAASLFGIELHPRYSHEAVEAMIDAMALFGIGASWGGYESLILLSSGNYTRAIADGDITGPLLRVHIGLEDVSDLIADFEQGFAALRAHVAGTSTYPVQIGPLESRRTRPPEPRRDNPVEQTHRSTDKVGA